MRATDLAQTRADIHLSDPTLTDIHKTIMVLAEHWATGRHGAEWHSGKVCGAILAWHGVANMLCVDERIMADAMDEYYAML